MLQASSPDEVALVKFAESLGFQMVSRTKEKIVIVNPFSVKEEFQILDIFPFTSMSKRMEIILRNIQSDRIFFYLKGADDVIKERLDLEIDRITVEEESKKLSADGLRTLAFSYKEVSGEKYKR